MMERMELSALLVLLARQVLPAQRGRQDQPGRRVRWGQQGKTVRMDGLGCLALQALRVPPDQQGLRGRLALLGLQSSLPLKTGKMGGWGLPVR